MMNDRMREEIDNMMQNITFDPAMTQRTRTKSRGHSITHAAKRAIALAVAAAILTTGAFALGVSLLQHIRNQMGSFGSQVVPVISADEAQDQGLKVSVVGSMSDSYNTKVYLSIQDITGDRLNENTEIEVHCKVKKEDTKGNSVNMVSPPRQLSYDKETKTAVFEVSTPKGDWIGESGEQHTISIQINSIQPSYHKVYCTENDTLSFTATGLKDVTLKMNGDIPAPGQTPHKLEGLNGIQLSAMGFDETGIFHAMFEIPEGISFRKREYAFSENAEPFYKNGKPRKTTYYEDQIYAYIDEPGLYRENDYDVCILSEDGKYFDYQTEAYKREEIPKNVEVNIEASYIMQPEIQGNWELEAVVDVAPEYVMSKSVQIQKNITLMEARLSPIGMYIKHTNLELAGSQERYVTGPIVIHMKDGKSYTFSTETHVVHITFDKNRNVQWYLDFANPYPSEENIYGLNQPLDITGVEKVTINGVEIPFNR